MKENKKHRIFNYVGENKRGVWLRLSPRASFDDLKLFLKYLQDRDNMNIFGITKGGTWILTMAVRKLIK